MRELSYLIVIVGILFLGVAAYDARRGVTSEPQASFDGTPTGEPQRIVKKDNPEGFHNAMTYNCLYGVMIILAGLILNAIVKGQDMSDPMAPDPDTDDDKKS